MINELDQAKKLEVLKKLSDLRQLEPNVGEEKSLEETPLDLASVEQMIKMVGEQKKSSPESILNTKPDTTGFPHFQNEPLPEQKEEPTRLKDLNLLLDKYRIK